MKTIVCFIFLAVILAGCDPVVHITSPVDGASFDTGETITFSCTARDFEDGELSGDSIVWDSSIDGRIGTGAEFTTDTLSQGEHRITVTAVDADGGYDTTTITITVGESSTTTTIPSSTTTIPNTISATYYVAPEGSDVNPGTEAAPWKTIQKAADTLAAGERVYIKAGTYTEKVTPVRSGTAGKEIIYAAYPGDTVTIDGDTIALIADQDGLINITDKNYIRISGFRIRNAGPYYDNAGIFVDRSDHLTIENNHTYNTVSSGIGVWASSNIIIDGNEVELACNDGQQECITVAGTDAFEIRNNHVHNGGLSARGGEGIDVKDGSSNGKVYGNRVDHLQHLGIYVEAWDKHTFNIEVFRNLVHDCENDGITVASEMGGLLENIHIYNNIAFNNKYNGMGINRNGPAAKQPLKDILVINNTFYNNGRDWGGGIAVANNDIENIVIRNNICSQNLSFQIAVTPDAPAGQITIDHNLIDGYREYEEGETYGSDYVEGNPFFVNAPSADFHLQAGSPAIDRGTSENAPPDDYDGAVRPSGQGYDIGAFEYTGG